MTAPRHFLITVGEPEYDRLPLDDQLPSAADDVRTITELFCADFGYERVLQDLAPGPRAPTVRERLGEWLSSSERRPSDRVIIYWSGHGETGPDKRHYLLTRDFDGKNFVGTACATEDLGSMLAGTCLRHVMLLLDTCFAGKGVTDLLAVQGAIEEARPFGEDAEGAFYLVAAARRRELAAEGVFSRFLVDAVNAQRHGGWTQPHLDPMTIVGAISDRMSVEAPGQHAGISVVGSSGGIPPLLPNPRHEPRLPPGMVVEKARRLLARPDLLTHWGPRSRGVGLDVETGDFFEGRVAALRAVVTWLERREESGARVVTGRPGSGKSALLARLAVLSDREYRQLVDLDRAELGTVPTIGSIAVAVHARGKSVADVLSEIADAFGTEPAIPLILEAAAALDERPAVLVDALDESLEPRALAREVLRPLATGRTVKLLVGTRSHVIPALSVRDEDVIDLDDADMWFDAKDVERYVDRLLEAPVPHGGPSPYATLPELRQQVSAAVARQARSTFLIARLVARSLAERDTVLDVSDPSWARRLPETVGEAFDEWLDRFGDAKHRVRDLLRPLAFSEGGGLPWEDVWPPIASAIAGTTYGDADVEWALEVAGAFIVESQEDRRSAYRLFHEALAEHLRPPKRSAQIHARIVDALLSTVPSVPDGSDWSRSIDYVRRHLATHAAVSNRLHELVDDPGFLAAADPTRLLQALATLDTERAAKTRAAYSSAFHLLGDASPADRASYLEMHAHRHQAPALADAINRRFGHRRWGVPWTNWLPEGEHFIVGRHEGAVHCVATARIGGRSLAVTGGADDTARVWDLDAGGPAGPPMRSPSDDRSGTQSGGSGLSFVGFAEWHGVPVVVTGGWGVGVRIWDIESGAAVLGPVGGSAGFFSWALPFGSDLAIVRQSAPSPTGNPASSYLFSRLTQDGTLQPLTTSRFEGRGDVLPFDGTLVFVEQDESTLTVLDLATEKVLFKQRVKGRLVRVFADGGEMRAVTLDDRQLQLWTVWRRGASREGRRTAPQRGFEELVLARAGGTWLAAMTAKGSALRVVDLSAGEPLGDPLVGHTGAVHALAFAEREGRPVIVSVGQDHTVRVWDADAGRRTTPAPDDHPGAVRLASSAGSHALVSNDRGATQLVKLEDGSVVDSFVASERFTSIALHATEDATVACATDTHAVHVWPWTQSRFAERASQPFPERVRASSLVELDGSLAVVNGSDRSLCVWRVGAEPLVCHPSRAHEGSVTAVAAISAGHDGFAVTGGGEGSVRSWDLRRCQTHGAAGAAHAGEVMAVAIGWSGDRLVAASGGADKVVRVWDVATMLPFSPPLLGHEDWVRAVAIGQVAGTPIVISGGDDRTIRVWSLHGEQLFTINVDSPVRALSLVGSTLLVGADAGTMVVALG